jgi:DNA-directed RNA polymerase subunit M/transcription elongation factor TFIIS
MLKYGKCGTVLTPLFNDQLAELECPKCGAYYTKDYLIDENEIDEDGE